MRYTLSYWDGNQRVKRLFVGHYAPVRAAIKALGGTSYRVHARTSWIGCCPCEWCQGKGAPK